MIPATENQELADGESSSPLAMRLDMMLRHAITTEQFEADMVHACRQDPEEIWTLLALLDQYHRLDVLPTDQFRALKASADRLGLVRREPYLPSAPAKPRSATNPPEVPPVRASAAGAPPVPKPTAPTPASAPEALPPPASSASEPPAVTPPAPAPAIPPPAAPEPSAAAQLVAPRAAVEPAPARALTVGSVIGGRYRLEAELESDDRGRNFQALDQQHAGQPAAVCQVAVHCMQPEAANFETVLAERRTEFQLAQPLTHPNVLSVRELDQDGLYIYLTMNLMRGETLAALLARRRGDPLARSAAYAIIRDVGAALAYAHDHGVVHGNLQPQCILISPAGELRVRGFGAQRATSCYASGEQLENRTPDRRDDLYSLACISYELLHGSHPFDGHNASTARGRRMSAARPIRLSGGQWRALRTGLAWRRDGRNLSIARWIGRMQLKGASKRLPLLEDLMAMPPPRRAWGRLILLFGCLAAAAIFAASLYRSPGTIDILGSWNALRAAVVDRIHLAAPESAPAEYAAPQAEATPPPDTAPAAPAAPTPRTATEALAAAGAAAVQSAPTTEPPAPTPQSAPPAALAAPAPQAQPPAAAPAPAPIPAPSSFTLRPAPPTAAVAANKSAPATPRPSSEQAKTKTVAKATVPTAARAAPTNSGAETSSGPAQIGLTADQYAVQPGDSAARILVRRSGGTREEARFVWWTENGTAVADQDYVGWGRRVERIPAGQGSVTLLVPVIKDPTRNSARRFYVLIGEAGDSARVGGVTRAAILLPGQG